MSFHFSRRPFTIRMNAVVRNTRLCCWITPRWNLGIGLTYRRNPRPIADGHVVMLHLLVARLWIEWPWVQR